MTTNFINLIKNNFENIEWKSINIIFEISNDSIGYEKLEYTNENEDIEDYWISFQKLRPIISHLRELYEKEINSINKFNKFSVKINKDSFEEKYYWDTYKEKEDKLTSAKYFYQWTNETMMNRIFDFEKENNLLIPNYDEDGDLIDYQESWDKGLFEFTVNENKISHKIILSKEKSDRNLPMSLPKYFIEGMLEHHLITNTELTDDWEPWNKLVIKSPNNSIPYDEYEKFVEYSMENANG